MNKHMTEKFINRNINAEKELAKRLTNRKVLFITTKNLDYIRNVQHIEIIKKYAQSYEIWGSSYKSYFRRLLWIYYKSLFFSVKNFDLIYISFSPQLVLPFFKFRFFKKFIIIDFFISVYDTLIEDRKYYKSNSVVAKFAKWLDRRTLKLANVVITDTHAHANYFDKELYPCSEKTQVLYLQADTTIFNTYVQTQKDEALYTVLYFGSMLPLQGVDIILESARILQRQSNIVFEIIGPVKSELKKKYQNLRNITFYEWLNKEELAKRIAKSDICLAGHFNADNKKAHRTIAGKTYIYISMNKDIILGENAANRELFDEYFPGVSYVEMGNPNALAEVILNNYNKKSS